MKMIFKVLSILIVLVIAIIILIGFLFRTQSEVVKIRNNNLKETIYLKQYKRGLSYELNVISRSRWYSDPDSTKEVVGMSGEPFFYKFKNDTLFIFGGWWENIESDIFETKILFNNLTNDQYLKLSKKSYYKEIGFEFFPPSQEKFINK